MHKHSAKTSKKEVENISAKVRTTKKEIEDLKNELQKLLNVGTQSSIEKISTKINSPCETFNLIEPSTSRKVPEPSDVQLKKNVPQPTTKHPPEPPKKIPSATETSTGRKTKTYNKAEAKEYIKKQREKRAEQLKAQINVADSKIDLKKQKLRELHQKATELVTKNVQLKRERSKSRDKATTIRLDRADPRQGSQENVTKLRPVTAPKSLPRAKSQEPQASRSRSRSRPSENVTVPTKPPKIDPKFLHPPEVMPTNQEDFDKSVNPIVKNNQIDVLPVQQKQMQEHSILTDACVKDTKETQTSRESEFVEAAWMKAHSALPCPYNFINTVKRKLNYAINSPRSHMDVGIQNSGEHLNGGTPSGLAKTKSEIRELLVKSARGDLHSFASHKAPNLDLKSVENLELVAPNAGSLKARSHQDLLSKNLFHDYEDSESDTSKNIPEISSESLGATTADSKLHLSLNRLKNLKLKKADKSQGYSYSSDFNEEKSFHTKTINANASSIKTTDSINVETEADASINTVWNKSSTNVSLTNVQLPTAKSVMYLDQKGDGDSQRAVKSLLTQSQLSKTLSEQLNTEISNGSLALKEPSIFLADPRTFNVEKSNSASVATVTSIRSKMEEDSANYTQETSKSPSAKDRVTEKSISDNLKTYSGSGTTVVDSNKAAEPQSMEQESSRRDLSKSKLKNITIRPAVTRTDNTNEIHLKFEAEVRLLNDFNKSFKQFMAVEKAFENIKSKKKTNLGATKILQNVDTQTSVVTKTSTTVSRDKSPKETKNSSVNYSRGSEIEEQLNFSKSIINRDSLKSLHSNSFSTDWNLSDLNESSKSNVSEVSKFSVSNAENLSVNACPGPVSLNIFDQLIKDEDTRIDQLKTIIKIREQALLDRTKSELVWLEIQKKQLIETGKIEEASALKKKQRGIILKHEQERNEMKKLRQNQKEASERRKNALRQERNLIKSRLSTDNMLSQISVKKQQERRSMGPLRVVQSCSESIYSETSISIKSSGAEDVLSITSKSLKRSDQSDLSTLARQKETEKVSTAKRTLFMREAALQKRRKTAEELLRWHRKLLDKERKIEELEAAATSVIKRTPAVRDAANKHKFTGNQLNHLWRNMTGRDDRRFAEEKVYVLSQIALERLCKSARQYSSKNKKAHTKHSDLSMELGAISDIEKPTVKSTTSEANYSSLFEPEEKTKISSSISELIDNFSRIEDEISSLSKKSELGITSLAENLEQSSQSIIEIVSPSHVSETEEVHSVKSESKSSFQGAVVPEDTDLKKDKSSVVEIIEEEEEENQLKEEHGSSVESIIEVVTEDNLSVKSTIIEEQSQLEESTQNQASLVISEQQKTAIESQISTTKDENCESSEKQISTSTEVVEEQTPENLSEEVKTSAEIEQSLKTDNQDESLNDNKFKASNLPTSEQVSTSVGEISELSELKTYENKHIPQTSSKDIDRESLALDEAIESASKIEESLTQFNEKLAQDQTDEESVSTAKEIESIEVSPKSSVQSEASSESIDTDDKTPSKKNTNQIDVRKRVSEILADASGLNKSPRLQDLYVTAYDVGVELKETSEDGRQLPTANLGSEAEELWRKQLAIEQEIKQLQLQQKEQLPYLFMREIPNKPPPPYTPPTTQPLPQSVLPTDVKEITEIASYSSKVLYKAYQNKNLDKVKFSENGFKLFSKVDVTRICAEFVFNICKDIAKEHCKQFETIAEPSWLMLAQKPQLVKKNVLSDASDLERIFVRKLKDLFGFKKLRTTESAIIKWGRKKRDHVDEVLVIESHEEESHWTSFEKDELIVKSQITVDIMKMLVVETAEVFVKILSKKKSVQGCADL